MKFIRTQKLWFHLKEIKGKYNHVSSLKVVPHFFHRVSLTLFSSNSSSNGMEMFPSSCSILACFLLMWMRKPVALLVLKSHKSHSSSLATFSSDVASAAFPSLLSVPLTLAAFPSVEPVATCSATTLSLSSLDCLAALLLSCRRKYEGLRCLCDCGGGCLFSIASLYCFILLSPSLGLVSGI